MLAQAIRRHRTWLYIHLWPLRGLRRANSESSRCQLSVGDYVLTGGELPAMTIVDSIVRLIPGVLGGESSAEIESFADGETLEFPQYTRPAEFNGMKVPDVLLNGHHGEIAKWRADNSDKAT